mmetsp:Transcript_19584/g.67238  ORF Transcript_19584/g.67238 Transcript_19584/m.67238 type:complete len:206 (-) Transcript_19584:166-783(-)
MRTYRQCPTALDPYTRVACADEGSDVLPAPACLRRSGAVVAVVSPSCLVPVRVCRPASPTRTRAFSVACWPGGSSRPCLDSSASSKSGTCRFRFFDWLKNPTWIAPEEVSGSTMGSVDASYSSHSASSTTSSATLLTVMYIQFELPPMSLNHVKFPVSIPPSKQSLPRLFCAAEIETMRTAVDAIARSRDASARVGMTGEIRQNK